MTHFFVSTFDFQSRILTLSVIRRTKQLGLELTFILNPLTIPKIMNKILIPLLIFLGSLLYSWFWNCSRKPLCDSSYDASSTVVPAMTNDDTDTSESEASAMVNTDTVMTEAQEEELLFTPLDLYFQSAKAGIEHTPEIDLFLSTAKKYLAAHPDKKLSIVGHTDSDGSEETNLRLSNSRAKIVMDMLAKEGFNASQMVTSGQGESQPISSNETEEGKAKNRRVTVRLMD